MIMQYKSGLLWGIGMNAFKAGLIYIDNVVVVIYALNEVY